MSDTQVPNPPPQSAPSPAKKGLSPLAWIAIIVGGVLVVCVIGAVVVGVFIWRAGSRAIQEATGTSSFSELAERMQDNPARTVAETMIRMNPELEAIETDEDAGTITVRQKSSGEVVTLSFADIAEGRMNISTADGEIVVDASGGEQGGITLSGPDGQTRIGGAASLDDLPDWVPSYPGGTDLQVPYQTTTDGSLSGALSGETTDDVDTVIAYYRGQFEADGYTVNGESLTRTADGAFGVLSAQLGDGERTLSVTAVGQPDATRIMLNYGAKTD